MPKRQKLSKILDKTTILWFILLLCPSLHYRRKIFKIKSYYNRYVQENTDLFASVHSNGNICTGEGFPHNSSTTYVSTFLTTEFEGGERHERRVAKIKALEEKYKK